MSMEFATRVTVVLVLDEGWALQVQDGGLYAIDGTGSSVLVSDQEIVDSLNNGMDDDPPWSVRFEVPA